MGLFGHDHLTFEIDRLPKQEPSLQEMTIKALELLQKDTARREKGFFVMIEGSKIGTINTEF